MKCDELIVYEPQDGPWGLFNTKTNCTVEETCYLKSEADEAIAELKCEIADARDDARSSRELIDEKNEEIAELKQKLHDAEQNFVETQNTAISLDEELTETRKKLHDAEMRADLAEAANTEYRIDIKNMKKSAEKIGYCWHEYDAGEDCYEDEHIGRWVKADTFKEVK